MKLFGKRSRVASPATTGFHSVVLWEYDHVRAGVIKVAQGAADILGVATAPVHGLGRVQYPDPGRWFEGCDSALTQAEDMCEESYRRKVVSDHVTMSVPDAIVQRVSSSAQRQRRRPNKAISLSEVSELFRRAYRNAQDTRERENHRSESEIVAASLGRISLDGQAVYDPVDLHGTILAVGICFYAIPVVWLRTLEVLAERLEIVLTGIVPQHVAMASLTPAPECLFVQIDQGETLVSLVKQQRVVWTVRTPQGAGWLAANALVDLDIAPAKMSAAMRRYRNADLEQSELDTIGHAYWRALQEWMSSLADGILARGETPPLPHIIHVADLTRDVPETREALGTPVWEALLNLPRCPQPEGIESLQVNTIQSWTRESSGHAFLPLRAMAHHVARLYAPGNHLDPALLDVIAWRHAS